jgi:threonine dehydrogenase-like Zn-dependent dehydrogenase
MDITGARQYRPIIGKPLLQGCFDRNYDTVGNSATLNTSMRVLKTMGTLSVVGIGKNVRLDLTPLWLKLQTIKGVYGYGEIEDDGEKRHVFKAFLDLMKQGKIKADILMTHKFRLEEYEQMIHVNMNKGRYRAMQTIVTF